MALPRPCIETNCRNVTYKGSRCTGCRRERDRARNAARPWYADPHYKRVRKHYNTHGATCWKCGKWLNPGEVTVDHDPPVAQVDDWRTCALQPACAPCNYANKAQTEGGDSSTAT